MAAPFTTYKLIILYMLRHAGRPLTNSQLCDFILLDGEYTDYFSLQQAVSELVSSDLLEKQSMNNTSYYRITEEGSQTLSYFEKELSEDIRSEVTEYLQANGFAEPETVTPHADYYETPHGEYAVRLQLVRDGSSLIDLNLSAPSREAARFMCRNWPEKYQEIYELIMDKLL